MMGRKRKLHQPGDAGKALPPCRVCGAPGAGFHYGANTCEACKGFFHRSLRYHDQYKCEGRHDCPIEHGVGRLCQLCRYQKCLAMGMAKEAIKTGRYTTSKRTRDILEVKSLEKRKKELGTTSPSSNQTQLTAQGQIPPLLDSPGNASGLSGQRGKVPADMINTHCGANSGDVSSLEPVSPFSDPLMSVSPSGKDEKRGMYREEATPLTPPPSHSASLNTSTGRSQSSSFSIHKTSFTGTQADDLTDSLADEVSAAATLISLHSSSPAPPLCAPLHLTDDEGFATSPPFLQSPMTNPSSSSSSGSVSVLTNNPDSLLSPPDLQHFSSSPSEKCARNQVNAPRISPAPPYNQPSHNTTSQQFSASLSSSRTSPVPQHQYFQQRTHQHSPSPNYSPKPSSSTYQAHPSHSHPRTNQYSPTPSLSASPYPHSSQDTTNDPYPPSPNAPPPPTLMPTEKSAESSSSTPPGAGSDEPYRRYLESASSGSAPAHRDIQQHIQQLFTDKDAIIKRLVESHDKYMSHIFEPLTPEEIVRQQNEHHEQCLLKKEIFGNLPILSDREYDEFYSSTGLDADNRQKIFVNFTNGMENMIRSMVKFAKTIPGFMLLDLSEKINLIKYSRMEFAHFSTFGYVDCERQIIRGGDGNWKCHMDVNKFCRKTDFDALANLFKFMKKLQGLGLTQEELVVLKTMIIMCPDRDCTVVSPLAIEIHWQLTQCFLHLLTIRNPRPLTLFSRVINAMMESRTTETELVLYIRTHVMTKYFSLKDNPLLMEMLSGIFFDLTECDTAE